MDFLTQERLLTELDHVRLTHLLNRDGHGGLTPTQARHIESLLDAVDVVPSRQIEGSFVTMRSQVQVVDLATGQASTLTVVYPDAADPTAGSVSVLSPVGLSLIGLRVGSVARWTTPDGAEQALEVKAVLFQPESSGDYIS